MNIIVQGKTLEITQALRDFVEQHAQKLEKVSKKIVKVSVFLEQVNKKENDEHRALVKYKVELPGKDICVKSRAHNLYDAVSSATDNAVRQVRKLYEKKRSLKRKKNQNLELL